MRKLALGVLILGALAVLTTPPAHAQTRCKSNTAICIGDKTTDLYVGGNIYAASPDGGSITLTPGAQTDNTTHSLIKTTLLDAGSGIINGNLQVLGNLTTGGSETITGTVKAATLDAGVGLIVGEFAVLGSTTVTTCTLGGQSPSTCTATVRAGSKCVCSNVGASAAIAAAGCAVGLSGTTLTVTSANAANNVVNIHCL